jgi:hypothetical protein
MDFSSDVMNEPRAALPPVEVSLASSAVSLAMYAFKATAALDCDSVCSGVRVETTPALIGEMILQSAADTLVEELAAVELAEADVAGADADAVGVELDDELDELQPAMRAPLAASAARMESDERLDISGTSMGVERSVASHENLVLPSRMEAEAGLRWRDQARHAVAVDELTAYQVARALPLNRHADWRSLSFVCHVRVSCEKEDSVFRYRVRPRR